VGKKKDFDLDRIDKILAQFPDEDEAAGSKPKPSPGKPALPAGAPQQQRRPQPRQGRAAHTPLGPWIRAAAGIVLALAMTQWPYGRACGLGLVLYLAGITCLLAVGVWAAVHAWRAQLARPFLTAQAVVLCGLALATFQVLPRVGYAKADAYWICPVPAASQTPAAASRTPEATPAQTDAVPADSLARGDSVATVDSLSAADSLPGDTAGSLDSIPAAGPDTSAAGG